MIPATNDWAGVPDETIKKVHVLASNYRNRGHEIKAHKKDKTNLKVKLVGSVILNVILLVLLII